MSQSQAFDALAPAYDHVFTHTAIGRYLRARAHERLNRYLRAGDQALELGCGTGADALLLAGRGVRVIATDVSDVMLAIAREKTAGSPLVTVRRLDLRALPLDFMPVLDGVFSNFGPLNCLADWQPLADWLAQRIRPGGVAAFGVMSPFCLWEPLWHGLHGDFRTATRRWRGRVRFQPAPAAEPISVHYPTIRRLTRAFAPAFQRLHVEALGLFLPPSDVFGAVEKRPRLLQTLLRLERRFSRWPALAPFGDHYWIEFKRKED